MPAGRRPIPTALKLVNGNPGGRPLNENEPKPEKKIPPCPKILTGEARAEWHRMTKKLGRLGLMTEIDRAAMTAYCQAWENFCLATDRLRRRGNGPVVKAKTGTLMFNPWFNLQNVAMKQMRAFLVEFGMSPSSRSRIDTKAAELHDDDDGLLG